MNSDRFRVVLGYLAKVAVPAVALKPGKYPYRPKWDTQLHSPAYRNYWNFIKDHQVELSEEESGAVEKYRDNSARINTYLRTGKDIGDDNSGESDADKKMELDKRIKHLDNAISKSWMKRPVQIWRNIRVHKGEPITEKIRSLGLLEEDPYFGNNFRKVKQSDLDKLIGLKFKEPAFASSSMSKEVLRAYPIRLLILLDRGQSGLVMNSYNDFDAKTKTLKEDVGMEHDFSDEHEILLPRDTVFQIEQATLMQVNHQNQIVLKARVLD